MQRMFKAYNLGFDICQNSKPTKLIQLDNHNHQSPKFSAYFVIPPICFCHLCSQQPPKLPSVCGSRDNVALPCLPKCP